MVLYIGIATIATLTAGTPVTIGTALPGYTLSVHDEILHPVQDGMEGELCISGMGVAKGYLNLPKKTKAKFIFMGGKRLYRTGEFEPAVERLELLLFTHCLHLLLSIFLQATW